MSQRRRPLLLFGSQSALVLSGLLLVPALPVPVALPVAFLAGLRQVEEASGPLEGQRWPGRLLGPFAGPELAHGLLCA